MRVKLIALLLVVVAACERGAPPPEQVPRSTSPRGAAADTGLAAFFDAAPVALGESRAAIAARLGAPDSVAGEAVANRHDPAVTDSILRLYYPGLIVEVYRAGYDGKEMVAMLQIADDRYLAEGSPVRLGATAADVQAVLGAADSASAERLEYTCDDCLVAGHETVSFALERGRVRAIRFRYWID